MPMALFSSSLSTFTPNPHLFPHKPSPPPPSSSSSLASPLFKKTLFLKSHIRATENGAGPVGPAAVVVEEKLDKEEAPPASTPPVVGEVKGEALESANGAAAALGAPLFKDPRWVGGTWDLSQFLKDGKTNWDAVIDAEVRRRKWLEDNPESTTNEAPIVFDTSIIPWWAWVKRFHLPEAELLNGRAAMVGFFMAYFVDSLTGVGLVDQMGNFFCKTLLFVAVAGVLLIRKNEDIENLKKLIDETTFYDKQWQATWQDDNTDGTKKD